MSLLPPGGELPILLNPLNLSHWESITNIPEGCLITCFIKSHSQHPSSAEEDEVLMRIRSIFEVAQEKTNVDKESETPSTAKKQSQTPPAVKSGKSIKSRKRLSSVVRFPSGPKQNKDASKVRV